MKPSPAPLRQILQAFNETYCGSIGVEFLHIQDKNIRRWLIDKMESTRNRPTLSIKQQQIILKDLLRTEALEQALSKFFIGQKRFSLEGSEAIIPACIFHRQRQRFGIEQFVSGQPTGAAVYPQYDFTHDAEEIFSTFQTTAGPAMFGGAGDVKYHIGYETVHNLDNGDRVDISMASNASHLESVDPVV